MLARDLGDCRDNLRNSQSVFLIVSIKMGILEVFGVVPVFFALSKNKKNYDFETDFLHILEYNVSVKWKLNTQGK